MISISRLTAILLITLIAPDAAAQDIEVRILDQASPRQIALSSDGGEVHLFAGEFEDPLATLSAGEEAIVSRASNQLHVKIGEFGLFATSLRVEPESGGRFHLAVREGTSLEAARTYRGTLSITPDAGEWALTLINEVDMEEYVASVVTSEYGLDDLEGSKAMAVIARTYALAATESDKKPLADHTLSQVYRGSDGVSEIARRAAQETKGEVLTFEGTLAQAVYFSDSGGHTADNEDVWDGEPVPYLRGKPDPYGSSSPHGSWEVRLDRSKLLRTLSAEFDARVEGFVIADRSPDGRVSTLDLLLSDARRKNVDANDFRLVVIDNFGARSLRSALFDARRDGDVYVFEGRGYGHGVGLSQWGAHEMAMRGNSYREILDFYYSGIRVASLDESMRINPPIREVASRPEEPKKREASKSQRIGW